MLSFQESVAEWVWMLLMTVFIGDYLGLVVYKLFYPQPKSSLSELAEFLTAATAVLEDLGPVLGAAASVSMGGRVVKRLKRSK